MFFSPLHPKRSKRGFTLIELVVALTGGLAFTVFVFMMTRDVSRFFQRQARLSDATLTSVTGFQRLRADIARAGFLASPHLIKDPNRCPDPGAADPAGWSTYTHVEEMALARINVDAGAGGGSNDTELTDNSLTPDQIVMWGNYTTSDEVPVRWITGNTVYLQANSRALLQEGYDATVNGGTNDDVLGRMFPTGRILRVIDETGKEQYSVITGVSGNPGTEPTVTIDNANLPFIQKASNPICGLRGGGARTRVNPVSIVRYDLRSLDANGNFSFLYDAEPSFNDNRLELVRTELQPDGTEFANSQELIAEYAVDFGIGLTVWSITANAPLRLQEGDETNIEGYAGPPSQTSTINRGAHLVRAIHPRLAVRTRAPDRGANIPGTILGEYRVALTGAGSTHARVRTLQANIATRNARNVTWP